MVTVTKRYHKVKTAVKEIRAVIEDSRAKVTGGITSGLEIWEAAVMPYLLNNSETRSELSKEAIELLENLQLEFLRNLLDTPVTCPKQSLLWETGTITMNNKIKKKKLLFYHHLKQLPHQSLAWEIGDIQESLKFPGLINECKDFIKVLGLPEPSSCTKL